MITAFILALVVAWIAWQIMGEFEVRRIRLLIGNALGSVRVHDFGHRRRFFFEPKIPAVDYADFFDLTAQGLLAGLPLERAWREALAQGNTGAAYRMLEIFPRAVQNGRSPEQALTLVLDRTADEDVAMILALLKQSLKHGQAIAKTLSRQAERLREAHLLTAERRAQTASLKMLFPIFVFILPAVFLILFGPFMIRLSQGSIGF